MRKALLVLGAATLIAFGLTLADARSRAGREELRAFAELTGGLGLGASSAIYWDFSSFDPRLEADCSCGLWPVPGGFLYSPEHRLSVFDPPELLRLDEDEEP